MTAHFFVAKYPITAAALSTWGATGAVWYRGDRYRVTRVGLGRFAFRIATNLQLERSPDAPQPIYDDL